MLSCYNGHMASPKISIIIPVYNVEQYIVRCLDSVCNQTFKDIEILIINDCSPDNSEKIILKYASRDARIKYIKQPKNMGQGKARNSGIKKALSPYIMFLDSDDWLELETCEIVYQKMMEYKCDCVIFETQYAKLSQPLKSDITSMHFTNINKPFKQEKVFEQNILHNFIQNDLQGWGLPCNKLFKKDLFIHNNIYFPKVKSLEDTPCILQIAYYIKKFVHIPNVLYNYYIHNNSTTNSPITQQRIDELFESYFLCYDFLEKKNIKSKFCHYIDRGYNKLLEEMRARLESSDDEKSSSLIMYLSEKEYEVVPHFFIIRLKNAKDQLEELVACSTFRLGKLILSPVRLTKFILKKIFRKS